MNPFLTVLLVALLPAGGSFIGSMLSEMFRTPKWLLGAALHGATGVAMGLVSIELMPRALGATPIWLIALLFAVGGAISVALSRLVRWLRGGDEAEATGEWKVYATTSADVFSDGLLTGATFAVSSGLGLLLALSQVVANVPGGFATTANFRFRGVSRFHRVLAATSYVAPAVVGAIIGFVVLRNADFMTKEATLSLIAGILLVTTIEELVPQADRPGTARWISTAAFVIGFVFIALLSGYVG